MVLNQREKIIAVALGAVIGALVLDRIALSPYLAARAQTMADTADVTRKLEEAHQLRQRATRAEATFATMVSKGLQKSVPDSEGQTLHALQDWAQAARFDLQSLKPDRVSQAGEFQEVRFAVQGSGSMGNLSKLLWSIETSTQPLRILELRMVPRKEGTDDLQVQLSVSTIVYAPPAADKNATRPAAKESVE